MKQEDLIALAFEARKRSYSPYSHFAVGAALLCENGKVYLGCNVENSSFSMTNCAERTAFFKAVSEGEARFKAVAIAGGFTDGRPYDDYCSPCGACRQVMAEFCDPDGFSVILCRGEEKDGEFVPAGARVMKLRELLPLAFYKL